MTLEFAYRYAEDLYATLFVCVQHLPWRNNYTICKLSNKTKCLVIPPRHSYYIKNRTHVALSKIRLIEICICWAYFSIHNYSCLTFMLLSSDNPSLSSHIKCCTWVLLLMDSNLNWAHYTGINMITAKANPVRGRLQCNVAKCQSGLAVS